VDGLVARVIDSAGICASVQQRRCHDGRTADRSVKWCITVRISDIDVGACGEPSTQLIARRRTVSRKVSAREEVGDFIMKDPEPGATVRPAELPQLSAVPGDGATEPVQRVEVSSPDDQSPGRLPPAVAAREEVERSLAFRCAGGWVCSSRDKGQREVVAAMKRGDV